ncbi:membrane protein [Pseudonocardia sulfidoxydans NBRC 16205]|uniref:Membrane protein n=1 Tax=Pseudonocardia sulfidoxydans NBRC 16205 TaxID=1223511 RepID=A0A511DH50_9PSEU|nr:membrane protein [Pseudonocardia sulfidoxydans NBRC 16205]
MPADTSKQAPMRPVGPRLLIYRIAAWVTGIGLLLLTFVALPLKYIWDIPGPTTVIGIIHGWLYMIYIVCTLVLAERVRWRPVTALLILLAGTIPIASFVAERKVTKQIESRQAAAG